MRHLTAGKTDYQLEFVSNFGYGKNKYTWFLSKPNYTRDGFLKSETVWVFTTDDINLYHRYIYDSSISLYDFIQFVKRNAKECYKDTFI